ncbi:MAG TPA: sulfotransferase domain-containing protein [Anaerolineales bacterium]
MPLIQMQARLVRRGLRRARQMVRYRQFSLNGVPVIFGNSFPKSGTHLLTQVLHGFTRLGAVVDSGLPAIVTFEGETGRQREAGEILAELNRLRPGDIVYGHLHALPAVMAFLCRDGIVPYFILRDPRDVVVSHVHYVTDMASNHAHHRYYMESLHSFDERLTASIAGLPDLDVPFPDIRARFDPYMSWIDRPEVLTLHFEEFVAGREAAIGRVLDHAIARGFSIQIDRQPAIEVLAHEIDPKRSPTFRRGKVGSWRDRFTPEHKQLFKRVSGDLLIRLGYEQSDQW